MSQTLPKVYIIILNWNKWEYTVECLKSVYAMDYPNFTIILIDNASDNDSVRQIKCTFPSLNVIENSENIGFTGGNNQGIKIAIEEGADYVWLLNNDTVVLPDTLSKLIYSAESDPSIGMVSPSVYYYDAPNLCQFSGCKINYTDFKLESVVAKEKEPNVNSFNDSDISLWGTALLIKCSIVRVIGYLRDDYFAYGEDEEYSLRSINAGYKNFVCFYARIYHKNDLPTDNHFRPNYYYYYSIRNEYYMWIDSLPSIDRYYLFNKLANKAISRAIFMRDNNKLDTASTCLTAIIHAYKGIRGKWDGKVYLSDLATKLILTHPYFLLNIILYDFKAIKSQIHNKLSNFKSR